MYGSREPTRDSPIGAPSAKVRSLDLDGVGRGHGRSSRGVIRTLSRPSRVADGAESVSIGTGWMRRAVPQPAVGASWCAERAAGSCALRSDWRGRALSVASGVAVPDDASRDRDERVPRMESHHERPSVPDLLDGALRKRSAGCVAGVESSFWLRALACRLLSRPERTDGPCRRQSPHRRWRITTRITPSGPRTRSMTMSVDGAATIPDVATGPGDCGCASEVGGFWTWVAMP